VRIEGMGSVRCGALEVRWWVRESEDGRGGGRVDYHGGMKRTVVGSLVISWR
jgi:hypothetical protein